MLPGSEKEYLIKYFAAPNPSNDAQLQQDARLTLKIILTMAMVNFI